jgi:hypothetical protein
MIAIVTSLFTLRIFGHFLFDYSFDGEQIAVVFAEQVQPGFLLAMEAGFSRA